jgi:glutaredoxin
MVYDANSHPHPGFPVPTMSRTILFLLALALAGGYVQNRARIHAWLDPPLPVHAGAASVILYATEWCGYCARTRAYLRAHQIAYEERDIEKSPEARAEYERLGVSGVPVIVVDGKRVLRGYDPELLAAALGLPPP